VLLRMANAGVLDERHTTESRNRRHPHGPSDCAVSQAEPSRSPAGH
jgi:hypothetical protein